MACADDAKASAKATANNLIIVTLLLKSPKAGLLPFGAHQPTSGPEVFDLDQTPLQQFNDARFGS
jgi:hypothetical protein